MVERITGAGIVVLLLFLVVLYLTWADNHWGDKRPWWGWALAAARNMLPILGGIALFAGFAGSLVYACMLLSGETKW